ncbi:hypothetical protein FRACA_3970004 [Frankia canadensis]|uniref:Uncharacterized protein n=1 Tax=Frankia canadensis TaxID=1836972 RepID=A0A2I2KWD0_9ACTN|nr:hypothetical protein FRACA_3970004 [Frankia canadensis]SOU57254.1 hypothetical protein FRACA_3970004 [Frankia canadensis]
MSAVGQGAARCACIGAKRTGGRVVGAAVVCGPRDDPVTPKHSVPPLIRPLYGADDAELMHLRA